MWVISCGEFHVGDFAGVNSCQLHGHQVRCPVSLSQQVSAGIGPELLCLWEIACLTASNCGYAAE